eukprot:jgi/Galph1/4303/GphlegSOOS_G3023.1
MSEGNPLKIFILFLSMELERLIFRSRISLFSRVTAIVCFILSIGCALITVDVTYGWLQCVVSRTAFILFVNGTKKIFVETNLQPLQFLYRQYIVLCIISLVIGLFSFSVFDGLIGPPWTQKDFLLSLFSAILAGVLLLLTQVYLIYYTKPTLVILIAYISHRLLVPRGPMSFSSCRTVVSFIGNLSVFSYMIHLFHSWLFTSRNRNAALDSQTGVILG